MVVDLQHQTKLINSFEKSKRFRYTELPICVLGGLLDDINSPTVVGGRRDLYSTKPTDDMKLFRNCYT